MLAQAKQQKRHCTAPMTLSTGLRPNGNPHTGQSVSAATDFATTGYTSQLARNSGGGVSIAGLASKNPKGFSMKPI